MTRSGCISARMCSIEMRIHDRRVMMMGTRLGVRESSLRRSRGCPSQYDDTRPQKGIGPTHIQIVLLAELRLLVSPFFCPPVALRIDDGACDGSARANIRRRFNPKFGNACQVCQIGLSLTHISDSDLPPSPSDYPSTSASSPSSCRPPPLSHDPVETTRHVHPHEAGTKARAARRVRMRRNYRTTQSGEEMTASRKRCFGG
jgi:hypothetical protein